MSMSELTTIARPYAKAAFELAVEKGTLESWNDMLFFAGHVASNEQASSALAGMPTATALWGYIPSDAEALTWKADFNWRSPIDAFNHI